MFQYVSLRNDGKNQLFTDIMNRYKTIQNDNSLGIRIDENNVRFDCDDRSNYPETVACNYNHNDLCSIMEWKMNNVVKNIRNYVLSSEIDDF